MNWMITIDLISALSQILFYYVYRDTTHILLMAFFLTTALIETLFMTRR